MTTFKFQLADAVSIIDSEEAGQVIARAEYLTAEPSYLLRYCRVDGSATEAWWSESALALIGR